MHTVHTYTYIHSPPGLEFRGGRVGPEGRPGVSEESDLPGMVHAEDLSVVEARVQSREGYLRVELVEERQRVAVARAGHHRVALELGPVLEDSPRFMMYDIRYTKATFIYVCMYVCMFV